MRWIKYGTQSDIRFTMVKRGVVDLAVSADWTPAAADSAISKDGGNLADTTNTVAVVSSGTATRGSVDWKLTISATEAQAAEINIQIVDAATKAVEDQFLTVYTYGNASAKFAGDWSDIVRLGLTGLANATPGAAGGLFIAGTNAATTITSAGGSALTLSSTGTNGHGLVVSGNGSGDGIKSTGGATGVALELVGGGTSGDGLKITTTSGHGMNIAATGTSMHGITSTGGNGGTSDGIKAVAGTGGVPIRGDITGNVTGNLSGSVGSVTGAVGSVTGAVGSVTGAVGSVTGAVGSVTGNVGGNVVGSVASVTARVTANIDQIDGAALTAHAAGKMPADVLTWLGGAIPAVNVTGVPLVDLKYTLGTISPAAAGSVRADAVTGAVGSVTGAVGSVTGAVGSVTGNVGGNVVGSVASVTAAVSVTGDLTATMKTSVENAVWDATMASHVTAGSTGAALNAAGGAGDPWITAIPGAYAAGSAGFILGNNLNAKVGDVKTQTDKLVFTVANKLDVNILYVNGTAVTGSGTAGSPWGP